MYSNIKFINCASCLLLRIFFSFVTAHKRSCGKVMFLHLSVSHSVHGGWGACVPHTPLPCTLPLPCMPPGMYTPWHICPPGMHTPCYTCPLPAMHAPCHACSLPCTLPCHACPCHACPCHACPHDMRSMSGRYASYLNAFLFQNADVGYIR